MAEQQSHYFNKETESQPLSEALWLQRRELGAKPITLENTQSSYGLPVMVGLREVTNEKPTNGQKPQAGFVFALFEDRSELAEPTTLRKVLDMDQIYGAMKHLAPSAQAGFDQEAFRTLPVAPVEPVGWLTLDLTSDSSNALLCYTSDLINNGHLIAGTELRDDPYFLSLSKRDDINALTVGFGETLLSRRQAALDRLTPEQRKSFTSQDQLPSSQQARLNERLHTRNRLGSLLLEQAVALARKLNRTLHFAEVSPEALGLLKKFADTHQMSLTEISPSIYQLVF